MASGFSIRYTPEPLLLCFIFAGMLQMPTIEQYIYKMFSQEKGFVYEFDKKSSSCRSGHINSTQKRLQDEVQGLAAQFNIAITLCWTISSIVSCLFLGGVSDRIGRRSIMAITIISNLFEAAVMLLAMIYNLPLYIFYIGAFVNGFGGGFAGIFMVSYAYIADVTDEAKLPIRMAILESANFISLCISSFVSGPLIRKYGFVIPQIIAVSLYVAACGYIAFVLKESLYYKASPQEKSSHSNGKSKIYQQPKILWKFLTRQRPQRWAMYLAILIIVLCQCFVAGASSASTLYFMNRPFCWPPLEMGNFYGTHTLVMAFGTLIGMKVFLKVLPRFLVATISPGFVIASFVIYAFSKTKPMVYGAMAMRAFGALYTPIYRATLSTVVLSTEQGSMFSIISAIEILFIFASSFVFNATYEKLNYIGKAHLFFFLPAGLLVVPMLLSLFFWFRWRKESNLETSRGWKNINANENGYVQVM